VTGNRLLAGWIGDCGVAVVRDGALAWITRDQLDDVMAYLRMNPGIYDDARRVWTRRELRNRPDTREGGKPVTYGVLTGEPDATSYIETASVELQPGDVIATHTDGFRPYFDDPEFLALLSGDSSLWEEALPALSEKRAADADELGKERSIWLYQYTV
jgi:serine/threonine protein phosphatase PrpC